MILRPPPMAAKDPVSMAWAQGVCAIGGLQEWAPTFSPVALTITAQAINHGYYALINKLLFVTLNATLSITGTGYFTIPLPPIQGILGTQHIPALVYPPTTPEWGYFAIAPGVAYGALFGAGGATFTGPLDITFSFNGVLFVDNDNPGVFT